MKLQDLTLKQLLERTAGSDPVPGGGSISAMHGATASALGEMLANLTIGKKNYLEVEDKMKELAVSFGQNRVHFLNDIDRDSDAYALVSEGYKMPKSTEDEQAKRAVKIEEATKIAATVPMEIAERAFSMLSLIEDVTLKGNKNAVTDGMVSMYTCQSAVLGALLNVRINISSLKDEDFANKLADKCNNIEKQTNERVEALKLAVKPMLA